MKKLSTINLIFLCTVIFSACQKKQEIAKRTIVAGKVSNWKRHPEVKELTLTLEDYSGSEGHTGSINNDGTFKIEYDQYIAQDVNLDQNIGTFVSHPGDSIHIDIDLDNKTSFRFTGDAARTNSDINKYTSEYYSQYEKYSYAYSSPDDFKAHCENIKAELLNKAMEFNTVIEPNAETKEWIGNYINIEYYSALLQFPFQYSMRNHLTKMWVAPAGFFDMKALEHVKTAEILNSKYYPLALYYQAAYWWPTQKTTDRPVEQIDVITKINKRLAGNDFFRQIVLGSMINGGMLSNDIENYAKNKGNFEPYLNWFIKQPLMEHREKIVNDFKNRHALTDATISKLAGTPAQGMIDSIRSIHKGKVVYFDFWSTWCGPCIGEMKQINKMEKALADPNVVFVGICIDSKKELWEKFKAEHEMPGEQYFATGKQAAAMRQAFKIDGVPRSILMDQNGDIVQSNEYLRAGLTAEKKINRLLGKPNGDQVVLINSNSNNFNK